MNTQINIKATNIELTPAINEYVEKRVTNLGKLLTKIENSGGEIMVHFEVGRRTNGQNKGDVFHADCNMKR
jgi:ribosomal subunit interface protein